MKITRLIAPALIVSLLALARVAQAADAPTVDSILAKHIQATGGKEAIEKVKSRTMKFKLESETLGNSEGEIFAAPPNKQRSHIDMGSNGTLDEGFDGKVAWAKTPWEGLRVKAGDELAKVKRDAEFYRDLKLKTVYPDLEYKSKEKVGEEEAYVLESKPTATSKEKFWFSTKSGLLIRQESSFEGPQGSVNVNTLAQDYKTIDGLKYPGTLKLKLSMGGQEFEFALKMTDLKHNGEIEPAKFTKPAE